MFTATQAPITGIDADTRLTEPHDKWLKRAPAKFKDLVPQMKMHVGVRSWIIDVYPNILGFGRGLAKVDPELRWVSSQIDNNAM
jgi:hypothetical protein